MSPGPLPLPPTPHSSSSSLQYVIFLLSLACCRMRCTSPASLPDSLSDSVSWLCLRPPLTVLAAAMGIGGSGLSGAIMVIMVGVALWARGGSPARPYTLCCWRCRPCGDTDALDALDALKEAFEALKDAFKALKDAFDALKEVLVPAGDGADRTEALPGDDPVAAGPAGG